MELAAVLDLFSWILLGLGALVVVLSGGAILRMPTFYTRIHAASVNETLGPGLIVLGLALQAEGRWDVVAKLFLVLIFLVLTSPLSAHALARAARAAGLKTGEYQRLRSERSPGREDGGAG